MRSLEHMCYMADQIPVDHGTGYSSPLLSRIVAVNAVGYSTESNKKFCSVKSSSHCICKRNESRLAESA